jgi:hypothetical protein
MSDFLLPSVEEATLSIVQGENRTNIEVIDIYEFWKNAGNDADKLDSKDWIPHFMKNMKEKFDVELTRTASVLLVEQAVSKLTTIKNFCSPEQKQ